MLYFSITLVRYILACFSYFCNLGEVTTSSKHGRSRFQLQNKKQLRFAAFKPLLLWAGFCYCLISTYFNRLSLYSTHQLFPYRKLLAMLSITLFNRNSFKNVCISTHTRLTDTDNFSIKIEKKFRIAFN